VADIGQDAYDSLNAKANSVIEVGGQVIDAATEAGMNKLNEIAAGVGEAADQAKASLEDFRARGEEARTGKRT